MNTRTQNNLLTTRTSQRRKYIGEVKELQVEQRRLATGAAPLPDQCWLHLSRTAEKDMTTQTAGGARNAPWPVTMSYSFYRVTFYCSYYYHKSYCFFTAWLYKHSSSIFCPQIQCSFLFMIFSWIWRVLSMCHINESHNSNCACKPLGDHRRYLHALH